MEYIGFAYVALGIISRMLFPWFVKIYKNNQKEEPERLNWEWRYLRGQLIASAAIFLLLPYLLDNWDSIGGLAFQTAYLAGMGVAEFGRLVDKVITE